MTGVYFALLKSRAVMLFCGLLPPLGVFNSTTPWSLQPRLPPALMSPTSSSLFIESGPAKNFLVPSLITCLYSIISLLNTVLHQWKSPCEHCFEFAALTVKAVLSRHGCQEATCCFTLFPDCTSITLKNETFGTNNQNCTDRIFYHHCLKCDV